MIPQKTLEPLSPSIHRRLQLEEQEDNAKKTDSGYKCSSFQGLLERPLPAKTFHMALVPVVGEACLVQPGKYLAWVQICPDQALAGASEMGYSGIVQPHTRQSWPCLSHSLKYKDGLRPPGTRSDGPQNPWNCLSVVSFLRCPPHSGWLCAHRPGGGAG